MRSLVRGFFVALGVFVVIAVTALAIREHRRSVAYDRAFAECVEYAKTNVSGVSPEAWCQP